MKEIEKIIEKMMSHYNVSNAIQLANQVGIHQSAISKWIKNDSVAAARKKCRELGIFGDIFGSEIQNNFQNANLSGSSVGVEIGSSNKTINNNQNDCGCDDELVKSLMRELCRKYKDDMDTLKTLLFQLTIQKS